MATAEGIWPKTGNDPLFDSAVNSFRQNGFFLTKSDFIRVGSSTDGISAGSIFIPAGSLSPICNLKIIARTDFTPVSAGSNHNLRIQLSGTGFGVNQLTNSLPAVGINNDSSLTTYDAILGSNSSIFRKVLQDIGDAPTSNLIQVVSFSSFPNSGLVLGFNLNHNVVGSQVDVRSATVQFNGFYSGTNLI